MQFSKIAVAIWLAISVAACGGGSDSASPSSASAAQKPQAPIGTAGVFDVDYGQFTGVYTFLDNGHFYGLHFGGPTLLGHPHGMLTPTNSVDHLEPIAWANFVAGDFASGALEFQGTFGRTFTPTALSVKIIGSPGVHSATATQQKAYSAGSNKTLYFDPIPMSVIAGTYGGVLRTVGIHMIQLNVTGFVIDNEGNFKVTAANCEFTGKLAQHGNTGIFDTQATVSGDNCRLNSPLIGIVTPLSFANNIPQLGVQLDSVDDTQSAVFILNKN